MSQPAPYVQVLDSATALGAGTRTGQVYAIVPQQGASDNAQWDVTAELHVTALTGTTPTVDVVLEGSGEATFTSPVGLLTFTQVTVSTNAQAPNQTFVLPPKIRARTTVGGTGPAATFSVILRSNRPFALVAAS